jgi:hypothetical protein
MPDERPEIRVTCKPEPPREVLFTCIGCGQQVEKPRWHYSGMSRLTREPLCNACTTQWGRKISGPVFNRQNFHTLRQLSAAITMLEWEIKNGRRHWR